MVKKILLILITLSFIFLSLNVDAVVTTCTVKTTCEPETEIAIFSLYQSTDSHVKTGTTGTYKVCCPVSLEISGINGNTCDNAEGADAIVRAYNSGTDAHVSRPESTISGPNNKICLQHTNDGDVNCVTKTACTGDELAVVSLYQQDDSHVGPASGTGTYNNKICCNICPPNFQWNEQAQECQLIPQSCLKLTETGYDPTKACQEIWTTPVTQTDTYWNDALTPLVQDCFADFASPGDVGQACCKIAEYPAGTIWGAYQPNAIVKEPISEILAD